VRFFLDPLPRPATLSRRFKAQAVSRKETSAREHLAASTACGLGLRLSTEVAVFTVPARLDRIIAGVMFSGKSDRAGRRVRRAVIARRHVQVFKSHLDAPLRRIVHE